MNERHLRLTASRGFHVFRVLRTFIVVNSGWFFDRCATAGDAVRMMADIFTKPEAAQVSLANLGVSLLDARILAVGVLLLLAVSLLGEAGKDVRGWLATRALPIRWAVMIGGTVVVLLLGIWGSGFSEASFIYFNF